MRLSSSSKVIFDNKISWYLGRSLQGFNTQVCQTQKQGEAAVKNQLKPNL